MTGGGDRPSKFHVRLTFPSILASDAGANEKLTFTCMAASVPPFILGVVAAPYYGRSIKLAGDREVPPWPITIINDEDHLVRRAFETWSHRINAVRKNTTVAPVNSSPASYKTDGWVYKEGKDGSLLRTYRLVGVWPSEVSQINLSWADRDRISEFSVVLQPDYVDNDTDLLGTDGSGASVAAL